MQKISDEVYDQQTDQPKFPNAHVRLSEEDGNAFVLISRTRVALRKAGASNEQLQQFQSEAVSGNYDTVLQTIMRWVATS